MIGSNYRIAAYDAKVNPTRLQSDLTALLPAMAAKMVAVTPAICAMELAVKQECDSAGVATITLPYYLDFGREMFRKGRQDISGETLALFAAVMIAKWVARGLTQSLLEDIRTNVFNVAPPVAP